MILAKMFQTISKDYSSQLSKEDFFGEKIHFVVDYL